MRNFFFGGVICIGLALGVSAAFAQTYADDVQLLDAQITLVQKRKQLQDNLGSDPILSKMPRIVAVMAFGGEIKAKLMLSNGIALTYAEGEVINQRMRVSAITPREVVIAITPTDDGKRVKNKKAPDPVLMPLEFLAGAQQNMNQGFGGVPGGPGVPGTPFQAGPIPAALLQSPPMVSGGSLATWPDRAPQGQPGSQQSPAPRAAVPALDPAVATQQ